MRCLAPAGGFPNPIKAGKLNPEINPALALRSELERYTSQRLISICSSGKRAIEKLVQHLSRKGYSRVVTAGYGCPDVVAASLRGGSEVLLADIDPHSLLPRFDNLDPKTDILLLSNLYGLVDPIRGLEDFQIIDDGCQAALSSEGGQAIGSRAYGVLSFGRGKAICGVGGGAIVGVEERENISNKKFAELLKNFIFSTLEKPELYWLPASIPFLRLGETHFVTDYKDAEITQGQCMVALEALKNFGSEKQIRKKIQSLWLERLKEINLFLPVIERAADTECILTRFPVIFPDGQRANRDKAYQELRQAGLGASVSYPASLARLCPHNKVSEVKNSAAALVAQSILTLPTHRYVKESDVEAAVSILKKYA